MITVSFLILSLSLFALFIILNGFFNNASARSLLIPESDDMEESAKNAKDVAKILSIIRLSILFFAIMAATTFSIIVSENQLINGNFLIFVTTFLGLGIFIILIITIAYSMPQSFLKRFLFFAKIIKPITMKVTKILNSNGNSNGNSEANNGNSDEIEVFEAAGISVDLDEMKMIKGILKMDVVRVREIMKPRVDLVTIEIDSNLNDLAELISESGYSKIPVIGDSVDDIKGIAYAKDTLKVNLQNNEMLRINEIMRPAIYVPESQNLEQLLSEFQDKRTRIAIVMDEHGGISGLVTVTDLIEEIVGELVDEFDQPDPSFHRINNNNLIIDAKVSISDLNEEIGSSIQINGYDTIGGLVYKELGKMPSVGDRVNFEGLEIVVQSTIGRRIGKLRIRTNY